MGRHLVRVRVFKSETNKVSAKCTYEIDRRSENSIALKCRPTRQETDISSIKMMGGDRGRLHCITSPIRDSKGRQDRSRPEMAAP